MQKLNALRKRVEKINYKPFERKKEPEWIEDKNGNRMSTATTGAWDEDGARELLETNKNCKDCVNCKNCVNCVDCSGCSNCINCSGLYQESNQKNKHK